MIFKVNDNVYYQWFKKIKKQKFSWDVFNIPGIELPFMNECIQHVQGSSCSKKWAPKWLYTVAVCVSFIWIRDGNLFVGGCLLLAHSRIQALVYHKITVLGLQAHTCHAQCTPTPLAEPHPRPREHSDCTGYVWGPSNAPVSIPAESPLRWLVYLCGDPDLKWGFQDQSELSSNCSFHYISKKRHRLTWPQSRGCLKTLSPSSAESVWQGRDLETFLKYSFKSSNKQTSNMFLLQRNKTFHRKLESHG